MKFRYTMKELEEWTDYEMLMRVVSDRQDSTTNVYSPLNKRLDELYVKLKDKKELTR